MTTRLVVLTRVRAEEQRKGPDQDDEREQDDASHTSIIGTHAH